ncbi:hypothetical protein SAMN02745111_01024 [Eubacterium uniforme]|uniref:MPN635 N-terminal domain-containing protein n=1 Tax=Eubacterium uniforme TaxID=39495 RepID=A0A1T4VJI7_9FIRM|nr:hypothetical protein [Eubacterium uniforme]SKA64741.1 hypothetical protein SAMN02745111_01024 [Eubacterium uniforme]
MRKFDLNIEKILDNWDVYHAIREIIANAIDESVLTESKPVEIFKTEDGLWHIRDFGRGIMYYHFTQNQNDEKLHSEKTIGKFGVGLKDALAVFYKNDVDVSIKSKYGYVKIGMYEKEGFSDTMTLHALIDDSEDVNFIGTEFILNVSDEDIEKAKGLFLMFSEKEALDKTEYGEIYNKSEEEIASIYVRGVKIAEESNYLFDYNITKINAALKKSLNRERSAVGRTAYSDLVKRIVLKSSNELVVNRLVDELDKFSKGTQSDEIQLTDIQEHVIKLYNEKNDIVFISSSKSYGLTNNDKEKIKDSGRKVVIIPDSVFGKIERKKDYSGKEIGTFDTVLKEYNDNFEYKFVEGIHLTELEKQVLSCKKFVFEVYGNKKYYDKIKISENINEMISGDVLGVYDHKLDCIVIRRDVLKTEEKFMEVLFHELVHATMKYPDNDRKFENELGLIIGKLAIMGERDD